jgi:hypothetical protein
MDETMMSPDDASDLAYSRALVDAALAVPLTALPMAYGLLEALDAGAMPGRYHPGLLCVLRRLGNCAPSPALRLLRAAQRAGAQPGARWDAVQCSPEWVMLCASGQDAHAVAALTFMCEIATANVQRLERAQAATGEQVRRAQVAVDAATCAAS